MYKSAFVFLFILMTGYCYGQSYVYSGKIIDAKTKKSLAFVTILNLKDGNGQQSNLDGKFTIKSTSNPSDFRIQYVGYKSKDVTLNSSNAIVIEIEAKENVLKEVQVIAGENPANKIIKKVIASKDKNNPERLPSFRYMSYNKFYFSGKNDPELRKRDSLYRIDEKIKKLDTTNPEQFAYKKDSILKAYERSVQKSDSLFDSQHIFLTETVTQRDYLYPEKNKEEVKAARISGLKSPQFVLIASQFQSFSFYKDYLTVLDKDYLSPISKGSTSRYFFNIEDTLYEDKDTVFILSFKPYTGKNFDALKGVLYINSSSYAIQNVIAEPNEQSNIFYIKIQQKYERIQNTWFPTQLNTDLDVYGIQLNNRKTYGVGRTYITDIQIGIEQDKKSFDGIVLEFDNKSVKNKSAELLEKYRVDTLDKKEQRTYVVIDSVGKAENLDEKILFATTVAKGYFPLGKYLRIDLNRLLSAYNGFEGLRIGFGLSTSEKFSKYYSIGSYVAWGTQDNRFKYGANLNVPIYAKKDVAFYAAYQFDVIESGATQFIGDKLNFTDKLRNIAVSNMDLIEGVELNLSTRSQKYFLHHLYFKKYQRTGTNSYRYLSDTIGINKYNVNEYGFTTRWAFGESFMMQANQKISLGTRYPVVFFTISYTESNSNDWKGNFIKYDLKVTKNIKIRNAGETNLQLNAGYIDGKVPYSFAYNGRANFSGGFTLVSMNYFETMRMNEFLSSEYASLFLMHDFKKMIFKSKYSSPGVIISSAAGWGRLNNKLEHTGYSINTMEKGYYESGLILKDLLILNSKLYNTGLGIGVFYRYGPYRYLAERDNLVYKLHFSLSF